MQTSGTSSWRLTHDIGDLHHVALFVRDALNLEVTSARRVPPRLAGPLPDLSDRLGPAERGAVAEAWSAWWEQVLLHGSPRPLPEAPGPGDALVALHAEARSFAQDLRKRVTWFEPHPPLDHTVVKTTVERISRETGSPLSAFDACLTRIEIAQPWWLLARRGEVLISPAAARDPAIAAEALEALFRSVLTRQS
jgi:hypothetical protein